MHTGATFTLLDALGQPMEPRCTADMLRLVSPFSSMDDPSGGEGELVTTSATLPKTMSELEKDVEIDSENVSYEVERVLDQRIRKGKQEYLVLWKGYDEKEATWEPVDHFDDLGVINRFWKAHEKKQKEEAGEQQPRRSTRSAASKQHSK